MYDQWCAHSSRSDSTSGHHDLVVIDTSAKDLLNGVAVTDVTTVFEVNQG